jgi:hypothetical protein
MGPREPKDDNYTRPRSTQGGEAHKKENAVRTRLILMSATWAAVVGLVVGSAHAQAPTQPGGQFSLIGVVMLEGGRDLAFIQEPSLKDNKVVIVRLGDNVGPYRVTKILTHQVELTGPGGVVVIPLAGLPGAVGVASASGAAQPSAVGTPSQPAGSSPPAPLPNVVIPRGDPRRNFPASELLVGAGAMITLPAAGQPLQASQAQVSQAQTVGLPAVVPPGGTPLPEVQLPRGDPRRNFPASQMLIGAGATLSR